MQKNRTHIRKYMIQCSDDWTWIWDKLHKFMHCCCWCENSTKSLCQCYHGRESERERLALSTGICALATTVFNLYIDWSSVCVCVRIVLDAHLNDLFGIISSVVLAREHAIDVYCLRVFLFFFTVLFDFWIFRTFRMCQFRSDTFAITLSLPCHAMPWVVNLFLLFSLFLVDVKSHEVIKTTVCLMYILIQPHVT